MLVFLSNYCVNIRFLYENTTSLGGYLLFEWALAFLSVVVGYKSKGSAENYGESNVSDKREQRKLAYSAERRKGRMKSNQITKQTKKTKQLNN